MARNPEAVGGRPLKRILAGTDGSERAGESVRQASRIAALLRADLILAYVIDTGRPHADDVELEADRALEAASDTARAMGVDAETRILSGDPGETLVDHAELDESDLVCLGPDAGLLGAAIRVGRVAAHVLREAHCSVLVARPAGADFPIRIACGVDGSEESVVTADRASALAAAANAELRLVHVVPVFRGDSAEWTLAPNEESPPELAPSVSVATSHGVDAVRDMAMGRPERALAAAARRGGCDLLVVGHRGVSGVRRVLLGSVSEHVVHHAHCSVMVVRGASNG